MKKRLIKKTGDKVSPLGFGAMRLPLKNGKIDREIAKNLIYHGIDNGINFIDTAALYGNGDSEKFLGEVLVGEYKEKVLLSTKLPVYKIKRYEQMEKTLNKQLERLNRDSIDYYFLHNIDLENMNRLLKLNVIKFLAEAKKEGKIKHVGFSYHGKSREFPLIVDSYDWDCVMVQYNFMDSNTQVDIDGIKHAYKKGLGIFIMEPLKGGILAGKMPNKASEILNKQNPEKSTAEWSLSWVLNHPEISCVLSGMNEISQIDENIAIASKVESNSLTSDEIETLDKVKEVMQDLLKINCTSCGYCMPCPRKVNIPECIKIYNEKYLFNQKGLLTDAFINYFTSVGGVMNEKGNAGLCTSCGVCIEKCPQHLDIPKELKKVKNEFEGHGFNFKLWFIKNIGMPIYQKFF